MTLTTPTAPAKARLLTAKNGFILGLFSLIYFTDVCLRASGKYFWFDELGTVNISRLPTMQAVWQTMVHGLDYNPPLFWILTRLSGACFGYGLIAARLPEMIGFWVACICLFAIAARRFGTTSGVIAMLFPLVTGAKYYAYEARPHGIVFGFGAIAALAWQRSHESRRRFLWLTVLCLSLTAADLTHVYAVLLYGPLFLAELYRTLRTRRVDGGVFCCMGISGLIAAPFLIILMRSYRRVVSTAAGQFFPVTSTSLLHFFQFLLDPALLIGVTCLAVFALSYLFRRETATIVPDLKSSLASFDVALAVSFTSLPVFAVILALITKGPFIDRYFISTVIGIALLVAFAASAFDGPKWLAFSIAGILACSAIMEPLRAAKHRWAGVGDVLIEPSSSLKLNTTPGNPMDAYQDLQAAEGTTLPIVVTSALEYAYLFEYASAQLRPRLWHVSRDTADMGGRLLQLERQWCGLNFNLDYTPDFFNANPRVLLYGRSAEVIEFLGGNPELQVYSILSGSGSSGFFLLDTGLRKKE